MPTILEVNDRNQHEWSAYVNSSPAAHFYYDYRWKKVLEESFGQKCFYLMAQEDKKVVGIFPLGFIKGRIISPSLISLPFLNYGGILADDEEVARSLLDKAIEASKQLQAGYIEIRNLNKSGLVLLTREHKVTMLLSLAEDVELQWQQLDAKVRNEVRKAQNAGLKMRIGKSEVLDEFYKVFCRNMRDLGTPVIGRLFFKNILRYFPQESNIFIVELGNKVIAGAFTLTHGGIIEVPWAASIRAYRKLCPNEFIYWEMIKYAILQGIKQFDFGRSTKESGTFKFKKQWNPQVKQLYWQYWVSRESDLPADNPQKSKFKFLIAIWKKLPLFIANGLGPHIAREIPVF